MTSRQLKWDGKKKWSWVSSPVSVNRNVYSVLAIIETLIACSFSLYVGIKLNSWTYLAGWIAITPLLLLRNENAVRRAIQKLKYKYPLNKYSYEEITNSHFIGLLIVFKAFIMILYIRISTIFQTVIRYRFRVISNIPSNWALYSLRMDLFHPLEVLPGLEHYKTKYPNDKFVQRASFSSLYDRLKRKNVGIPVWKKSVRYLIYSVVFLLAFFPSFLYRWSIKSTSLVYMSFIFLSKDITFSSETLLERSNRIQKNKFSLFYAVVVVIIIYTILPILITTFTNFLMNCSKDSIFAYQLINYFTIKPCIERWNIARLICALITVVMSVLASMTVKLIRMDAIDQNLFAGRFIDFWLRTIYFIRSIGASYVILCGIILFCSNTEIWEWLFSVDWILPEIGSSWFPKINR